MAAIPQSTLETIRDNLLTAYTTLSTNNVSSYSIGDRSFTYQDRGALLEEIMRLDKLIARRDTTSATVVGYNRVDFSTFRVNDQ